VRAYPEGALFPSPLINIHRPVLPQNPDKFLKVSLCGTFKNLSKLLKSSIGCN
jgi:hypothetical protein